MCKDGFWHHMIANLLSRVIALLLCPGDAFRQRLIEFTKPYLKKTIPSLFSALKSLYRSPEKVCDLCACGGHGTKTCGVGSSIH